MKSRADKIIEGFKLGSLGAGSKKFVAEPSEVPTGQLRVLKQGFEKKGGNPFEGPSSYPYIYWQDRDGFRYFINMDQNLTRYSLFFWGGKDLEVEVDEDGGRTSLQGKSWMSAAMNYRREQVFAVFEGLTTAIESQGIEGLLKKGLLKKFKAYSNDRTDYNDWLEARKAQFGIK